MLSDLESRLNLLELKCRRPVEHLLAGEYRSVFRGRGIEFEDVRAYQPGDDVRTMDWKVTARTGEAHIKRYIEEREQFIYLLIDLSGSMLHDPNKRQSMVELCSLLAMAAIKNQDRVGLILFSDEIEEILPPGKGRSHAMRIMDLLMNYQPKRSGTDFRAMLARFGHMARKHSIAFVVSDFLVDNYKSDLQALAFRHDLNAIHIGEPTLEVKGLRGLVRMRDAESGTQRVVDLKAQEQGNVHHATLTQSMLEAGVNLLSMEAGQDCVEALAGFFHSRQRKEIDETGG
ncbi:DUF58 domain-containing protein [Coraliomargarita akajimensis]|uniref:DUF58 domain-containing protein n=1 Tax=Coraliomargarita akajimensis (strain DSM 45221 / IAM 15411 / JCM 23193 / KCTC 12865 / 04OKA010-24) TaxID=583355 RepID=D5ENW0_CORAD|nr:DUF58 domain-containing protein [Coraliomargarita akajimensis]ADE53619.1 protein of unknown function DUF58 [Coraliomargarita akajimensis DSM 45221]